MRLMRKLSVLLILLAVAVAAAAWFLLRQSLPRIDGQIEVAGLAEPVEVLRDAHGVPHLYARSESDLWFALGYVHAQDRLWQMEMNRRTGSGRLSELFGPTTVDTDRFLRMLGVRRHAQQVEAALDAQTRGVLTRYAEGVNAFLGEGHTLPPEFLLTGSQPEPWTLTDSLVWITMMAWDLNGSWKDELDRLRLSSRLDTAQMEEFFPGYPGDAPVKLPDLRPLYAGMQQAVDTLLARAPEIQGPGAGSNNWVVSGARSASGKPLLANDPHLGLTTPALWYFAHLEAPGLRLIGATLPGLPGVVLGRNERIAWGFTNTAPDAQDLYVERVDSAQPANYLTPEGSTPFDVVTETLRVKGQPDVQLTIRATRHGPVMSDAFPTAAAAMPKGHVLAFAWTALAPDNASAKSLVNFGRARNWEEFVANLRDFHAPQQNIVYADVEGNIGFYSPGRVPLRKPDNDLRGLAPAPGWDARYDWAGFIPFAELPHAFNPPQGVVATANHKVVPQDYPYWISHAWHPPYRFERITTLLEGAQRHDAQSFAAIQNDVRSGMLASLMPAMLAAPQRSDRARAAVERLKAWDYAMSPERAEPLIATAWLRELARAVYADELGAALFADKQWDPRPIFLGHVLSGTGAQTRWCDNVDTPARETCHDVLAQSLEAALTDLDRRYGTDERQWRWGEAHRALMEHRPFSKQALLRKVFELGAPTGGDGYTVNMGRYRFHEADEPFANRHGPSLRAIYDLADPDASRFVHTTGQSAHPLSPFRADMLPLWAGGRTLSMTMKREQIQADPAGRLMLQPPIGKRP